MEGAAQPTTKRPVGSPPRPPACALLIRCLPMFKAHQHENAPFEQGRRAGECARGSRQYAAAVQGPKASQAGLARPRRPCKRVYLQPDVTRNAWVAPAARVKGV